MLLIHRQIVKLFCVVFQEILNTLAAETVNKDLINAN